MCYQIIKVILMEVFKTTEISLGDISESKNYVQLDKVQLKFSFSLQSEKGSVEGYCDLTSEEYEIFNSVFNRMVNNVRKE